MQLEALLRNFASYPVDKDVPINGLTLNTRLLKPQDAFIAIKGLNTDGRSFIPDAIKKRASVVLAEANGLEAFLENIVCDVPIVPIPDLHEKLGLLAGQFYQTLAAQQPIKVGITGTNGKSTCCFLISQGLQRLGVKAGVIGTLGFGLAERPLQKLENTTPDAVTLHKNIAELKEQGADVVALEVSSHGLSQNRVQGVGFESAIFTSLSQDHLDYHKTMARYLAAKCKIFANDSLKRVIINDDIEQRDQILSHVKEAVPVYLYSLSLPKRSRRHYPINSQFIYAKNYELTTNGIYADIVSPFGEGELRSNLLGDFNLSNLMAVMTELCLEGHSFPNVLKALSGAQGAPGRMQRIKRGDMPEVIIDYAHTPDALAKALKAAKQHCKRRLWCVFGCGGERDQDKRKPMGEAAVQFADKVILTNDNPRREKPEKIISDIIAGITAEHQNKVMIETDRKKAIYQAVTHALAVDTILIAGKGHEDYQDFGHKKIAFNDMQCVEDIFTKGVL